MEKKFLIIGLIMLFVFSVLPSKAWAADDDDDESFWEKLKRAVSKFFWYIGKTAVEAPRPHKIGQWW